MVFQGFGLKIGRDSTRVGRGSKATMVGEGSCPTSEAALPLGMYLAVKYGRLVE